MRVSRALMCYAPGYGVQRGTRYSILVVLRQKDVKTPARGIVDDRGECVSKHFACDHSPLRVRSTRAFAGSTVVCSAVSCLVLAYKTRDK